MRVERTSPSALTFAKLLGDGPMARVALEASLAEIESAAFIVSTNGTVLHTNPAGATKLGRSKEKLHADLLAAVMSLSDSTVTTNALVTPLRCSDQSPLYYLVIFRAASSPADTVEFAASLWELTPRQKEVLELVAEGFSNKTIAVRLACAERTIETHLTAIFQKSGLDGRNALLAAIAHNRV